MLCRLELYHSSSMAVFFTLQWAGGYLMKSWSPLWCCCCGHCSGGSWGGLTHHDFVTSKPVAQRCHHGEACPAPQHSTQNLHYALHAHQGYPAVNLIWTYSSQSLPGSLIPPFFLFSFLPKQLIFIYIFCQPGPSCSLIWYFGYRSDMAAYSFHMRGIVGQALIASPWCQWQDLREQHLYTAVRHTFEFWVVLCGAPSWTLWSSWVPSNFGYSMFLCIWLYKWICMGMKLLFISFILWISDCIR